MSWIDPRLSREKALALFSRLSAIAEKNGRAYFPLSPDPSIASYYTSRPGDSKSYISDLEGSTLASLLGAQWADRPELLELVASVVDLHESVIPSSRDNDGDISPFIYEMF